MLGVLAAPSMIIAAMVIIVIMMILISEFAVVPLTGSAVGARLGMGALTIAFLVMTPFIIGKLTANEVTGDTKSLTKGTLSAVTSARNLIKGD